MANVGALKCIVLYLFFQLSKASAQLQLKVRNVSNQVDLYENKGYTLLL